MDKKLIENEIFYCEPLLAKEENLHLIQKFHVAEETGLGLETYLKRYAISDEMTHEARTYLVKDNLTDEIVGYFSLKTGMVASRRKGSLFHMEIDSLPAVELALNFRRLGRVEEAFVHRNYKPRYDEGCIFMSRPLYADD